MDTENTPTAGRPKRTWVWWLPFTVTLIAMVVLLIRPAHESPPPPSIPVAVQEGDLQAADATLEEGVRIAREGLERMDKELVDYTGRMLKRERIGGTLGETVEMEFKIRTRRPGMSNGGDLPDTPPTPMSVYLRFLKPESTAGREVIWVEDQNEGNLIAHEGGFANLFRVNLDPNGFFAMQGNLHPLTEIGFKNLVRQLLERSEAVREAGGADVTFVEDFPVGDRPCLLIQVRPKALTTKESATGKAAVDFWLAEIAIDLERGVPLRYAAYARPESVGAHPPLIEEYIYLDVQLNVGLTDADFDPDNPEYNFP